MNNLVQNTNLDYLDEPYRTNGKALLSEMLRLQELGPIDDANTLWTVAAKNLGNHHERYCQFYICLECGNFHHGDYSNNSDPDRDFCDTLCESNWVDDNPNENYHGEIEKGEG